MPGQRDCQWTISNLQAQYLVDTEEVQVTYVRTNPTQATVKARVNYLGDDIPIDTVDDAGEPNCDGASEQWSCTAPDGSQIVVALYDGATQKIAVPTTVHV
jgi:hypothetical protein